MQTLFVSPLVPPYSNPLTPSVAVTTPYFCTSSYATPFTSALTPLPVIRISLLLPRSSIPVSFTYSFQQPTQRPSPQPLPSIPASFISSASSNAPHIHHHLSTATLPLHLLRTDAYLSLYSLYSQGRRTTPPPLGKPHHGPARGKSSSVYRRP